MTKQKNRRQFSQEFKREAVRVVTRKGLPLKLVAEDLGIHVSFLVFCSSLYRSTIMWSGLIYVEWSHKSGGYNCIGMHL